MGKAANEAARRAAARRAMILLTSGMQPRGQLVHKKPAAKERARRMRLNSDLQVISISAVLGCVFEL